MVRFLILFVTLLVTTPARAFDLSGEPIQGGLMIGQAEPGASVTLDGKALTLSPDGVFIVGFHRDETGTRTLVVTSPDGQSNSRELTVATREYNIERVDGVPQRTVTPDPEATARIREEGRMVANAKARRDVRTDFAAGFVWPAKGRISGVYGSQRILNGEPRSPHYGVDVAAPTGTLVTAPAAGIITLTHPDLYFSGGTIILDHGHGLTSSFLHLSEVLVEAGQYVEQGDPIAKIGATGRATGPHLDWRMSWLDRRIDPQRLVGEMPSP